MEGFFTASEIQSSRPAGDIVPKCGACGLFKGCTTPKMAVHPGMKDVLIVGDSPSYDDDDKGRHFQGDSGQFLRESISRGGFNLDDYWHTNSTICHHIGQYPQKGKEVGYCRPNLAKSIENIKPRVIITLGKHALESVLTPYWKSSIGIKERDPIQRWVGRQIPVEDHWICPTWSPSHVQDQANRVVEQMFLQHLESALSIKTWPRRLPDFHRAIELLYDEREIINALRYFDETGGLIAFDYESNCLKPEYPESKLFTCAVSNGRRTVAYPWIGRAIQATSLLLRSSRTEKVASNMKFEQRWTINKLKHPVTRWGWDTMLAAHAMDNRAAVCSLKFQAFVQLGVPSYNDKIGKYLDSGDGSHYNRIAEAPLDELLFYNGMDALLEWFLAKKQRFDFTRLASS